MRHWTWVLGPTAWLLGCGAAKVQPLENTSEMLPAQCAAPLTAADYSAHLDVMALGYADGTLEVRTPAPQHVFSRGKHGAAVENVALSGDGTKLASVDANGAVAVSTLESGELQTLPSVPAASNIGLAWDPSGRWLAVCSGRSLSLVEVDSGDARRVDLAAPAFALAFAPDGKGLVAGGSRLFFLSFPQLRVEAEMSVAGQPITDLRFSHDGKQLGALVANGAAFIDVASHQVRHASFAEPRGLRFAQSGRVAVFGKHSLYVGEPNPADISSKSQSLTGELRDVEFREDGSLLYLGDVDAELLSNAR